MAALRVTILGCGSSGGVPRLGNLWGDCDPHDPRNARRRCAVLVERVDAGGVTRVLIDTGPDLRAQLLDAGVGVLDAVIYTHSHADHVHGLDDLRMIFFNTRRRLDVWADAATERDLRARFGYAFEAPEGSEYPPILNLHPIENDADITVTGAGGALIFRPLRVAHGSIDALGFRVGNVAYLPDVSEIYPAAWDALQGLECWIVDALRRTPHPTHAHLARTLDWIARAAPRRAVLTNMHVDLDYATVAAETPDHIVPAHDGLVLTFPA